MNHAEIHFIQVSSAYEASFLHSRGFNCELERRPKDDFDFIFPASEALTAARREYTENKDLQSFLSSLRRIRWEMKHHGDQP